MHTRVAVVPEFIPAIIGTNKNLGGFKFRPVGVQRK